MFVEMSNNFGHKKTPLSGGMVIKIYSLGHKNTTFPKECP